MGNGRPGTRIPFWSPYFKNRPGIEPPGMLKIVAALSILSVVGSLFYAIGTILLGSSSRPSGPLIYIAVMHFLIPLGIAYSVGANSLISRLLLFLYVTVLCGMTAIGAGFLGALIPDSPARISLTSVTFVIVMFWLWLSPKMRVYYALISESPLPDNLPRPAAEYMLPGNTERRLSAVANRLLPYAEIVAIIIVLVAVILAWLRQNTGW